MDILGIGDRLLAFATSLWRRHRFGARVRLDLGWDHLPILSLNGDDPRWRAIAIEVTAPKADEFVIAKGSMEARAARGSWVAVCTLDEVLSLPIVVESNRQWHGSISGKSLATKLNAKLGSPQSLKLRLTLEDHHGSKIRSEPIAVTMQELVREERV